MTDPVPAEPVTVPAPSGGPTGLESEPLDVVLPAPPDPAPPDTAVVPPGSEAPADCLVSYEAVPALQEATSTPSYGAYGSALYLPALKDDTRLSGDGQHSSAPPEGSASGSTAPPAPGNDRPGPWPQGTGLPAPNALPAAPGSGSGTTLSSGGPGSAAAWLPSQYLVIPTAGAEPIRGPLQHVHSAVAADPGSSPD
ncbi:hypothetical protein [Arthrobacter sp. NicSoilB4]|uniref:hypothetical protein n=1 Tax=Arthrobacter sp. NicSoilB4 TaxID=2830997 RepID=UPI001CC42EC0|nr:hypothetical protein [Arthrobacter sp. NicSoilB4]